MKKAEHQNLVLTVYKMNKTNPTCLLIPYSAENKNLFATSNETNIQSQSRILHLVITNTSSYFLVF